MSFPMNAAIPEVRYRYGTRPGGDHCYIVAWPNGVVKIGSSWYERRWRAFVNRGGTLIGLLTTDNYYGYMVHIESKIQDVAQTLGPRAFANKQEAVAYLGGNGAGYMECWVLDDAALLTLETYVTALPTKAVA